MHLPLVPFFSAKITSLYLPAQKKSLLVEGKKKTHTLLNQIRLSQPPDSTAILNILINVDSSKIIVYSGFRCSAPEKLGNEKRGPKNNQQVFGASSYHKMNGRSLCMLSLISKERLQNLIYNE